MSKKKLLNEIKLELEKIINRYNACHIRESYIIYPSQENTFINSKIQSYLIDFAIKNKCEVVIRHWNEHYNQVCLVLDAKSLNDLHLNYGSEMRINPYLFPQVNVYFETGEPIY